MSVGVMHANETWHEITGSYDDELTIGDDGKALFKVHGGKLAVWVRKRIDSHSISRLSIIHFGLR